MNQQPLTFPKFEPPAGLTIHDLGSRRNWPALKAILATFQDFSVIDAISEDHLRGIASHIHASRGYNGNSILHWIVWDGDDGSSIAEELLALGVDPNPGNDTKWTPGHTCGWHNMVQCAKAIGMCRPDLSVVAVDTRTTPVEEATQNGHSTFWDFIKDGFASIAHLACDKKWWAVKNLIRRRALSEVEKFEKYSGKDAIEWADFHGEHRIADELRYFLVFQSKHQHQLFLKLESRLDEDSKKLEDLQAEVESAKEGVCICVSNMAELRSDDVKADAIKCEQLSRAKVERKEELQDLEARLLSKVDSKLDQFQEDFEKLKNSLKARDEIVNGQMKAIREEVAKISMSAAGFGPQAAPTAKPGLHEFMATIGSLASNPSNAPRRAEIAASNSCISADDQASARQFNSNSSMLVDELLAVIEKYRH